jgi:hypothetical protein
MGQTVKVGDVIVVLLDFSIFSLLAGIPISTVEVYSIMFSYL